MKNLKKYILLISLLLPMLVMMAHDIIPHHHHEDLLLHAHAEGISDGHQHSFSEANCCHHNHAEGLHLNHKHQSKKESCCHFTHHRIQQELKFQIFLVGDMIRLEDPEELPNKKYFVSDCTLIPEPHRISLSLRAPPALFV